MNETGLVGYGGKRGRLRERFCLGNDEGKQKGNFIMVLLAKWFLAGSFFRMDKWSGERYILRCDRQHCDSNVFFNARNDIEREKSERNECMFNLD
jgi:hypothetical protein